MIGSRIKELRKQRNLSITELSRRAGVSKSYLSYIERDVQKNPSLKFLSKIAATLDTSIEYLLGEDPNHNHDVLDGEWTSLLQKAIDNGLSKEDFREFQQFIQFRNWKNEQEDSEDISTFHNGGKK
ncbi:helix-turn-helix domain-containing protein [Bacillus nitroreducens]